MHTFRNDMTTAVNVESYIGVASTHQVGLSMHVRMYLTDEEYVLSGLMVGGNGSTISICMVSNCIEGSRNIADCVAITNLVYKCVFLSMSEPKVAEFVQFYCGFRSWM